MNKAKGFICVLTAAFIFGFTPILGKLTYYGGSNPIMLVFLRNLISIPILYATLKFKHVSIKVPNEKKKKLFIYSLLTTTLTALLLYSSYTFVSVGMATTVHYVYPILVALILVIFFKEKISAVKIISLAISFIGILMFFDGELTAYSIFGLIIAFVSGIAYGLGLIYMDKSGLKETYPFLVTFYSCIFSSVIIFFVALVTQKFTLALTPTAWLYSIIISILVSALATTFMQIGVKYIGPTTTAILCMFEPITSVLLGIMFLDEPCTVKSVIACVLILSAVIILTVFKDKKIESKQS